MNGIEKLTDGERAYSQAPPGVWNKALRIIDQLTAALEDMTKTASAGCARCLEREGDAHAKAEVARLTAALEAAERKADDLQIEAGEARKHYRATEQNVVWVREQRIAAESRAEALQARVAELEAEKAQWQKAAEFNLAKWSEGNVAFEAAESELATAKARVAELEQHEHKLCWLLVQWLEHADANEWNAPPYKESARIIDRAAAGPYVPNAAESELADLRGRVERAEALLVHVRPGAVPAHLRPELRAFAEEALRGR
ncbi:MAG TPA: hypothetical protein VGK73_15040 [Polyangiaceae bacterium]